MSARNAVVAVNYRVCDPFCFGLFIHAIKVKFQLAFVNID